MEIRQDDVKPGRLFLHLARHGETVWNLESRMQGRGNSELTPDGLAGAQQLAEALSGIPLMAAFSSPARRALETARLALAGRPVPLIADDRIHEMALGRYEGLTVADAYALDPENADAFFHHADRFLAVEGESFADVMERIARFLQELTRDPEGMVRRLMNLDGAAHGDANPAGTDRGGTDCGDGDPAGQDRGGQDRHILIISHNITVKVMLAIMRDIPLERLRDGHSIPQARLISVVFEPHSGEYRLLPEAERILGR